MTTLHSPYRQFIVILLFVITLQGQEENVVQDSTVTYGVILMTSQPMSDFTNSIEAPLLLDTLMDMPAEELMLIDTIGATSLISTETVLAAMVEVAGENEFCKDESCVVEVASRIQSDKIFLVDLSQVKAKSVGGGKISFSGILTLSLTYLGVGRDIDTEGEIALLVTEKTLSKKIKGDWDEFAVRVRSRTWLLMSVDPPEGRFPPEPVTFELSQLLLFFEASPVLAILVGVGLLSGLVVGYVVATRPPVIGSPPPYPESM